MSIEAGTTGIGYTRVVLPDGRAYNRPNDNGTFDSADYIILATTAGGGVSHTLRKRGASWEYGERLCFSDSCACSSHATWRYQDATEAEAREIAAQFARHGCAVRYGTIN